MTEKSEEPSSQKQRNALAFGRLTKQEEQRVGKTVCKLTDAFARNPAEEDMVAAVIQQRTGDAKIDAYVLSRIRAIWQMMEATR